MYNPYGCGFAIVCRLSCLMCLVDPNRSYGCGVESHVTIRVHMEEGVGGGGAYWSCDH